MTTQYDEKFARAYQERDESHPMRIKINETYLQLLEKEISGLTTCGFALDLGCGAGRFTRPLAKMLKEKFSDKIVWVWGIDHSWPMLSIAKEENYKNPLGIHYEYNELEELPIFLTPADIITSVCGSLHYAESIQMLERFVSLIAQNLKPGGIFIGINNNPEFPVVEKIMRTAAGQELIYPHSGQWMDAPFKDGSRIQIFLYDREGKSLDERGFMNWYYSGETYARIFAAHGLSLEWIVPRFSAEDAVRYPDWVEMPAILACFRAVKER